MKSNFRNLVSLLIVKKKNDVLFTITNHNANYFNNEIYDINYLLRNIRNSKFKSFFKELQINTPAILNKTKSLKRLRGSTSSTKLVSYLNRHGKKLKTTNTLLMSLYDVTKDAFSKSFIKCNLGWSNMFLLLSTFNTASLQRKLLLNYTPSFSTGLNYETKDNYLQNLGLVDNNSFLRASIKKLNFLFSFYIYKVDKNIFKNSRGKSGKYTFIWKYVPLYKRSSLIFHWLAKEIRITNGKKLISRISTVLNNFINFLSQTWVFKIKKFSLNYVYYNLRRSLAETYRTSLK